MSLHLAMLDGPVFWAILAVALLLFGGSKIPELARGLSLIHISEPTRPY